MTSLRNAGLVLALLLATAPIASAQNIACDVLDDGSRDCRTAESCETRRECIEDAVTVDWHCAPASGASGPECMAACTTMFGCTSADSASRECPVIHTLAPTCQPAEGSTTGVCTYRGGTVSNARITYCTDGGDHVAADRLAACHSLPRDPTDPGAEAVFTPDYYRGDCDGDGCPNGGDSNPCAAAPGACAATVSIESPYCPAGPPPLACKPVDDGVSCTDARPCAEVGEACEAGAICEDGWSDGPRCRPSCSTLFLCSRASMTRGEGCPPFGGARGTCAPLPFALPAYPLYDGVCVYDGLIDSTCTASSVAEACFTDVETGQRTANFFRGDCDGDTIPNGCDPTRCRAGAEVIECVDAPGAGCSITLEEDAGVPVVDAGSSNDDAGSSTDDAGTTDDGGTRDGGSFDGGASLDDGGGQSFSGGGGCRCSAAGGDRGGLAGLGVLAGLAIALVERRRR